MNFWSTRSPESQLETANVKKLLRLYHDRGFEVVGINLDRQKQEVELYLQQEPVPWTTLHTMDAEGNDPTALRYGIRDVPTTLLLNKDGKVVSTEVRGDDLAVLLEKLLGPPYSPKGALSFVDIQPMASRFDSGEFEMARPRGAAPP